MTGDAEPSSVLQSDFVLPSDESTQKTLSINLDSVNLSVATDSAHITPSKASTATLGNVSQVMVIQTYSAVMNFSLDTELEEEKEISIPLRYDVHFVTAHPCTLRQHTEPPVSLTSPLSQVSGRSQRVVQTGWLLNILTTVTI